MGGYFSRPNARIVEHVVARYDQDDVNSPEVHIPACAKVPTEFSLKPKYEQGRPIYNFYN